MPGLKRMALLLVTALLMVFSGCIFSSDSEAAIAGNPAPDFELQDINGQTVTLAGLRGKPVVLNFWATWCSACRSEMPYLQDIYDEWAGQGAILLVNTGETAERVKDFMDSYSLSMPVVLDTDESVTRKYAITALPTTFFIRRDGIIQEKYLGAFPSKEAIKEHLLDIIR